ncbi:MAG: hypothetical protein KBG68_00400 [Prevotella sp.]|nr:hypothetical protein [Prevotella sp.]
MENKVSPTDLRLGNWLYDSQHSGFPMQVYALGKDWVQLNFDGNEGDVFENTDKEIYPIPITKELIVKSLNAEPLGDDYSVKLGDYRYIYFRINNDGYISIDFFNYDDNSENEICDGIRYVHELQNIYHDLAEKELEIRREWL